MQTRSPLGAKHWFKTRGFVDWFTTIFGFIILDGICWLFLGGCLGFFVAGTIMFCLYSFVLTKRKIAIECPSCKKPIALNTPWVCGSCEAENHNADEFPFLYRCLSCGAEPKAYECHHCGELIFLSEDQQRTGYARSITPFIRPNPILTPDPVTIDHAEAIAAKQREIELKRLAIEQAKLDAELKRLQQSSEGPKRRSIEDLYRETVKNEDDAEKLRTAINEQFKDNEIEREKRLAYLKNIIREIM